MIRLVTHKDKLYVCDYYIDLNGGTYGILISLCNLDGKMCIGHILEITVPDAFNQEDCDEFDSIVRDYIDSIKLIK